MEIKQCPLVSHPRGLKTTLQQSKGTKMAPGLDPQRRPRGRVLERKQSLSQAWGLRSTGQTGLSLQRQPCLACPHVIQSSNYGEGLCFAEFPKATSQKKTCEKGHSFHQTLCTVYGIIPQAGSIFSLWLADLCLKHPNCLESIGSLKNTHTHNIRTISVKFLPPTKGGTVTLRLCGQRVSVYLSVTAGSDSPVSLSKVREQFLLQGPPFRGKPDP